VQRISSSSSELETAEAGAALARTLAPGAVVYVEGELGAGKTAFVRGAARALGVRDLYRSVSLGDEDLADLEPYFDDVRATFIEWAVRGAGMLPPPDVRVHLRIAGADAREIVVVGAAPESH
jgi:tRNA threonylcarbamoyladenosine biosynthesis protein TsaE